MMRFIKSQAAEAIVGVFDPISLAPPDPIFGLMAAFAAETRSVKVNLGVGVYKDEHLNTPILPVVKKVERLLLENEQSKTYLPIEGDPLFIQQVGSLVFGKEFSERICGFQTPGGTGGLCVGSTFLYQHVAQKICIPDPSWLNHKGVLSAAGFHVDHYPYYDYQGRCLQFDRMLESISQAAKGSVVLFHASCHNPTGADLNLEQWKKVAEVCRNKQLLPFFDCAYQGLGQGIDQDVDSIRLFTQLGMDMVVVVSQSKNFSLYAERVGALYVVTSSKDRAECVRSRVKQAIRTHYSNPPAHGAKIVGLILGDPQLRQDWEKELGEMRNRINTLRDLIASELMQKVTARDFSYLKKGLGMFCFTGLNQVQVERLIKEFGIYLTTDGRMNICGLNSKNKDYVMGSMIKVLNSHA